MGRDVDDRAELSASADWSGAPRRPAMPCAVRRGIAPASAWWEPPLRSLSDGRRCRPALVALCGSFATTEPDPELRRSRSPAAAPPRWFAYPPAAADTAW